MTPPLVIVSGMPASGKSTLAASLRVALHLPLLAKDDLKEALTRVEGLPADRAASSELGARTMVALYELAAAHLDRGIGIVLECNFKRGISERQLRPLVARASAVIVHCTVGGEVAIERYRRRAGTRHGAHIEDAVLAEADPASWEADHDALDLGVPVLAVDTSDGYRPGMDEVVAWVDTSVRDDRVDR